jgi:aminoglycoside/choline kinase family phosphotransferase
VSPHLPFEPELAAWLQSIGLGAPVVVSLPGDVSPRRYARLLAPDGTRLVLATYPPELLAVCSRFATTSALLAAAGVRVPAIVAADCTRGFMVLEDLGERTVAELGLGFPAVRPYFAAAMAAAQRIAQLPVEPVAALNPPLDGDLLARELEQTWDRYFAPRGLVADPGLASVLRDAGLWLARELGGGPLVPCHRDFMVRNLMPLEGGGVAVLDHQDLRLGPVAYDVASLLNDTLFPPPEDEARWVAESFGEPGARSYRMAGAQRCLKAVGTYAAFAARGFARHAPLIVPTLRRGVAHLGRIAETAELARALTAAWHEVLH